MPPLPESWDYSCAAPCLALRSNSGFCADWVNLTNQPSYTPAPHALLKKYSLFILCVWWGDFRCGQKLVLLHCGFQGWHWSSGKYPYQLSHLRYFLMFSWERVTLWFSRLASNSLRDYHTSAFKAPGAARMYHKPSHLLTLRKKQGYLGLQVYPTTFTLVSHI